MVVVSVLKAGVQFGQERFEGGLGEAKMDGFHSLGQSRFQAQAQEHGVRRGEIQEAGRGFMAKKERPQGEDVGPCVAPFGDDDVDDLGGQSGLDWGQVPDFVLAYRRVAQFGSTMARARRAGKSRGRRFPAVPLGTKSDKPAGKSVHNG